MSLSIIPSGPNSVAPFARAETFVPDQLIAGHLNLITQDILVAAGRLLRGTILGASAFGATVAAGSSNKGNGTVAVTQASGEKSVHTHSLPPAIPSST